MNLSLLKQLKLVLGSLAGTIVFFVTAQGWYKAIPEVLFELKFVQSDPEEFRCTRGYNSVQSKGNWVVLVKNTSPTPIVIDNLKVVTWNSNGGTVVSVDERNPVGYTHKGPGFLRLENFRVEAGSLEERVIVDWLPESSVRSEAFIKKQGCQRPYSWENFKKKTSGVVAFDTTLNMTITINVEYGQGKSKFVVAKQNSQYQAWVTAPIKLFSF